LNTSRAHLVSRRSPRSGQTNQFATTTRAITPSSGTSRLACFKRAKTTIHTTAFISQLEFSTTGRHICLSISLGIIKSLRGHPLTREEIPLGNSFRSLSARCPHQDTPSPLFLWTLASTATLSFSEPFLQLWSAFHRALFPLSNLARFPFRTLWNTSTTTTYKLCHSNSSLPDRCCLLDRDYFSHQRHANSLYVAFLKQGDDCPSCYA
jgi:hypothetical protein